MMRTRHFVVALTLLAIAGIVFPKEEILPSKKGKKRDPRAAENPMYDVADDMDTAARRLNEAKTDDTTQTVQETIVEKLDKLIEAAEQQSSKQPQGGGGEKPKPKPQPKPTPDEEQKRKEQEAKEKEKKPASAQEQKKTDRPGLGRPGQGEPTGPLHTDAEEWGNLPPAVRDQLLQTQGEGFPLKYRELLRRYYLELSKPRD
ncbi:MAG: hypothetical protein FJ291_20055 [Planctomycetes bacterium]|nr:hypothetical protein [Planctomycetota bacterium]